MRIQIPESWRSVIDGWIQDAKLEDGKFHVRTARDPAERALIMARNADLRREGVQRDLSFGRQVASIPLEDYYRVLRERPELKTGDPAAWRRFLTSPEARGFLVRDTEPGRF